MAERVVDVLEVIQVQKDDGQRSVVALCGLNRLAAALGQQGAVGQAGQGVVMRQPVNALLVLAAFADFLVQVFDGFTQLACALLHHAFKLLVHLLERCLGLLVLGDVQSDPDAALARLGRVKGFAAHVADHDGAVFFAEGGFCGKGLALGQRALAAPANVFPVGVVGVPNARQAALQLAGLVAKHLFKMPVATCQAPLAQKHNADHGVVKQHLFFPQRGVELFLRAPLVVNVVDDPNRAFGGVFWIDQAARQAAPKQAAVAPAHQAIGPIGLAGGKHWVSGAA